ncbi:uncharacterized protein FIBRA_04372 [Fibroporia radiculosa]|uniref:RING-type domain-containing protein n=1 Tax=Fibroporia radiculosa TaxID=599839 RepID=J4GP59_9APHY|nr:uncharacterized protein FIBRA_04372 [Fibroporia radiculosa]CCM02285.1 predicted protein [Fibroporia radiculosa]
MRLGNTIHIQPLIDPVIDQRNVDLEAVLSLLKQSRVATSKGKKRAAPPTPPGPNKRARISPSKTEHLNSQNRASEDLETICVYRHVLDIRYECFVPSHDVGTVEFAQEAELAARCSIQAAVTTASIEADEDVEFVEDDCREESPGSREEVGVECVGVVKLSRWLKEHVASQEGSHSFDLGSMHLEVNKPQKRSGGKSVLTACMQENRSYVLTVPGVDDTFDTAAHDIRLQHLADPLSAFHVLETAGRAEVNVNAYLHYSNDGAIVSYPGVLVFRICLEVEISLISPTIFEPIIEPSKQRASDVEEAQRRALLHIFPSTGPYPTSFHSATDVPFLYSILGPAPRLRTSQEELLAQPKALLPTLLPFQRRSVAWMLSREATGFSECGAIIPDAEVPKASAASSKLPLFWEEVSLGVDAVWYNRLRGIISRNVPEKQEPALGGILAEEPGLGKTLECIALVLLNPSIGRDPSNSRWDPESKLSVKEIKTTLIVTPGSLARQWADELALHAPTLKVLMYDGWSKTPILAQALKQQLKLGAIQSKKKLKGHSKSRSSTPAARTKRSSRAPASELGDGSTDPTVDAKDEDDAPFDWCTYVHTFDVCITTYAVLQQDLGVARPPPTRPRRAGTQYSDIARARSPLVKCQWYRVIMDEVQMVGGGKAEEMVSLIPRVSSFAVSGTPARAQTADLIHVVKFLRIDEVVKYPRVWLRLLQPAYVNEFTSLFCRYAIRTVKAAVSEELTIPHQTRYLVPIELGRIERHVYNQNFENALLDLGLDARGVAVRADWELDTAALRFWLRKLRGICTHPQVGQLLNNADKLHKPGVLKTIGEGMREQNWRNLMEDRRNKVQMMSTLAQLQQRDEAQPDRYRLALDILIAAEKEALQLIGEVKAALAEHGRRGEALKPDNECSRATHGLATPGLNGKGKARASSVDSALSDLSDSDDEGLPRNPAREEHAVKRGALQNRLRECWISHHKVLFLKGDVYHVLGESYADAENQAYADAEDLRRLLLKGTEQAAARAMTQLNRDTSMKLLTENDLYIGASYLDQGGIRSAALMEEANEIIEGLLNEQSALLWQWRQKLIVLLTQSLTANNQDADGQEYARSLETQGEAEAYLQAYAALLADRREALTAERTLLATHDVREKFSRHTKAAQKAAGAVFEDVVMVPLEPLGEEHNLPEHEVLLRSLNEERKVLLEEFDPQRAVKSVMVDLHNIAARIYKQDDPEGFLIRDAVKRLRTLLADQAKLMDRLQADLGQLRKAFNERISYFRQLQEISDTVAEAAWEGDVADAIVNIHTENRDLETKINTNRARQRYLDYLAKSQEEGTVDEDERCCVLCRSEFTRGYITPCAHVFCESCLKEWRFSLKKNADQAPPGPVRLVNNELVPMSRREINYNVVDPTLFEDIQAMESFGSYGSKIQTLVRHLLYLQITDSGAKSIIFSAWADSLLIIQHALAHNGIESIRIDQHKGKESAANRFRLDPSISVLLLHGERENAGLNVTCASRVFLVESVVHHGFELQAIARIDRMGQTRPTEVYCYYAEETVERNILDLAARQGQSLYTKDNSAGTLDVTPFALPSNQKAVDMPAKKMQKGDFVFKTDDMLAIFFPHLYEDLEYLLPPEDAPNTEPEQAQMQMAKEPENAVAGPSRLSA